jgi:CDP-glycerol glycerophosphotransferase (TagB/SpsB family)
VHDILITDASVVEFGAAVMEKLVIVGNLTGKFHLTRNYQGLEGMALEAESEKELREYVSGILTRGEAARWGEVGMKG